MASTESLGEYTTQGTGEEDLNYAMRLSSAFVFTMAMNAAMRLKLLDIISRAGMGAYLSAKEIASQLPTKNSQASQMVDRILRLLASYSVVTCTNSVNKLDGDNNSTNWLYGLAPISKYFLNSEGNTSLAPPMQLLHCKAFMDTWYGLEDAVLEGGVPFNRVHEMHVYEYTAKFPQSNELFNKAMINLTRLLMENILDKYKGFKNLKELVDVGGGLGLTLQMITSKYPNIKAINFDLPQVIQDAPPYSGVQYISGDMFTKVPKGEAILLKNCYAALPDDGKIIVIELLVPETVDTNEETRITFQLDLIMLAQFADGKERSRSQYESLATKAGFSGLKLECHFGNFWVMEIYK
ncbi:hypothetical protein JCGZ_25489 [Jatropha curcas]|uniref:O-methyltransferase domain-containing protein n=1 Tax=Jatropha curcas TaxID=180498 RepID=A0A067JXM5_JATCU|nr:hypothetical protein JCGZ_25489 [Jatropha curcas]